MIALIEQQLVEVALVVGAQHRGFAVVAAQLVDDLVFEDADEPGLQLRLAAEGLRLLEGSEQGVGNRVLGPGIVAQLRARIAHQLRSQGLHLPGKVGHASVLFPGTGGSVRNRRPARQTVRRRHPRRSLVETLKE